MDTLSPWNIHLGPLSVSDILIFLCLARLVCDPRFTRRREHHPLDFPLAIFLLSFVPAIFIGTLHRDPSQPWGQYLYAGRCWVLLLASYLLASRLIPILRESGTNKFIIAPLLGVVGAVLGAAYRGLVLHQIMDRAGSPILLTTESCMLPTFATLGVVYLTTGRRGWLMKIIAVGGIFMSMAILLLSTRRGVMILGVTAFFFLWVYLPKRFRMRSIGISFSVLVVGAVLTLAFTHFSGRAGQMWMGFMTGESSWTKQGTDYRMQELNNVLANLNKYGGWWWGEGLGRSWERLAAVTNLYGGAGFGADMGHVWIYGMHFPFLHNLLDQGIIGLGVMMTGLFLILKVCWTIARRPVSDDPTEVLNRALLSGILAGLVASIPILTFMQSPNGALFVGALAGALDSVLRRLSVTYHILPDFTSRLPVQPPADGGLTGGAG
jgi:hypothetical protein